MTAEQKGVRGLLSFVGNFTRNIVSNFNKEFRLFHQIRDDKHTDDASLDSPIHPLDPIYSSEHKK